MRHIATHVLVVYIMLTSQNLTPVASLGGAREGPDRPGDTLYGGGDT